MAIIYSYPNGGSAIASDKLTISRSSLDAPIPNPTFTLTVAQIATFVQNQLASGTPNYIPVFNTTNTIIDSPMFLDDFATPTLLTIGNDAKIQGNLVTTGTVQIDTLNSGFIPYTNPQKILADSIIYQDAEGHVGIGVVGIPPNPKHKFEVYDLRDENNALDYSMIVSSDVNTPGVGAGGIKNQLSFDGGVTYPYAISLVTGTNASEVMATGKLAFYSNSNLNTSSATGFSAFVTHDGTNPHWQLGGAAGDASPAETLKVVGGTNITGDVRLDTLTIGYMPFMSPSPLGGGRLRNSGFYQAPAPPEVVGAIGLNTDSLNTFYGEYPDFRVASRFINTPGVIDLFRNDASVTTGESVGILQYSVLDDGRYAVAQIGVETLSDSGVGVSGGGKFIFKTARGIDAGTIPESRFELDNTEADFSVPINVTSTVQSSFAGQVTIPLTPVADTDAASKGYVDAQNTGTVTGTGTANTLAIWSDADTLTDSSITEGVSGVMISEDTKIMGDLTIGEVGTPGDLKLPTAGSNIDIGTNTVTGSDNSIALGSGNIVTAAYAIATGQSNNVTGNESIAAGFGNTVSNIQSQAFGIDNTASAEQSTAFGNATTASGAHSFSTGFATTASGLNATVHGTNNTASGTNSFVSGANSTAGGFNSTALGNNLSVTSGAGTAVGVWNLDTGFYRFQVGVGTSELNRKNAFSVASTGAIIAHVLAGSASYANDAQAGAAGVPIGGLYRNGSIVQIRIT
jgi:hypothetical protein